MSDTTAPDIVARLLDFDNEGITSSDRFHLRRNAAQVIIELRSEVRLARKCHSCGEPLNRDCPNCKRLWER